MTSAEDLSHQGKPGELFLQKQGEDLAAEDLWDNLIMETTDMMKSAIGAVPPSVIKTWIWGWKLMPSWIRKGTHSFEGTA